MQHAIPALHCPNACYTPERFQGAVQDVSERAAIDKGRQEAAGLVEARAQAAEEERARQWRVVRCVSDSVPAAAAV